MENKSLYATRIAFISGTGLVRKNNEDSILTLAEDGIFAVMDGMGGADAGEIASSLVQRRVEETLKNSVNDSPGERKYQFQQSLHKVNAEIIAYMEKNKLHSMGTTLVALLLDTWDPRKADVCHIGDSRCYCLRNGELFRLTEDHVLSDPQKKNVLTNSIGGCSFMAASWSSVSVCPEDCFILCSDGLTSVLSDEMILKIVSSKDMRAENRVAKLQQAILTHGAPDNYSIICIDIPENLPPAAMIDAQNREENDYLYSIAERRKDYGR